jgi:hypothetical protein
MYLSLISVRYCRDNTGQQDWPQQQLYSGDQVRFDSGN